MYNSNHDRIVYLIRKQENCTIPAKVFAAAYYTGYTTGYNNEAGF